VSLAAIRFASVAIDAANENEISGLKIAPRRGFTRISAVLDPVAELWGFLCKHILNDQSFQM